MGKTLSIGQDIQAEDLETKLKKATSLSEDQIKEIVPVILSSISEIQKLEEQKAESTTKENLLELNQSITNDSNVSINMKNNKGTVIWTMNFNEITNNISITINHNIEHQTAPETSETNQATTVSDVNESNQSSATSETTETNSTSTVSEAYSNNYYETTFTPTVDIYTPSWLLTVLNKLLDEIEDTKNGISKKWLSKSWQETMNLAKQKLKQYKNKIEGKKKKLEKEIKKWTTPKIHETDIQQIRTLQSDIDAIRQDVSLWQWWELSNLSPFLYNSPENAKKANKQQEKLGDFEKKMKEEIKNWAIKNIFNNHEQNAIDFYRRIAEWRYTQADYDIYTQNIWILNPSFQRCWINTPILMPQLIPVWWVTLNQWAPKMKQSRATVDYSNMDWWETFQRWWLAWVLDKALSNCKNMTPWQRNTWKSIGVLWGYAAWIYWLYKFFTSKKMNIWWKAWITAAAIFWSQALTWEWPISLFQKLMTWWFSKEYLEDKFWNAFWDAVNWIWNSWIEASNTLAPAMYSMMIFKPSMTVWETRALTSKFNSNPDEWKDFRGYAITKLKNKYGENSTEHFSATFSDKFDEQKWTNRLASFWVTDSTADSTKIYELANNASMNEIILEKFRSEHWVKETSNETKKKEFHTYISNLKTSNQALDIKELEKHPDWFELDKKATYTERPEDIQFKETLVNQVSSLSIDEPKKSELRYAIQRFYDERTIDAKPIISDFSLESGNGLLTLKSHNWQETKFDISKNEIVGFWHRFSDLSELLNVADISNKILDSQKWKAPKDMPPFQYKLERKWICFNDATSVRKDILTRNNSGMDTRVLSTWRFWATSKIDTLSQYPDDFAKYLSNRWIENNKVKTNADTYPILHDFSEKTWIIFTNEQEAKDLETWLSEIKEWKKFAIWNLNWKPFNISWQFKTLNNKLMFTAVDWTKEVFKEDISEKFPTIMANKDKFLTYINDKSNWMRWSNLN